MASIADYRKAARLSQAALGRRVFPEVKVPQTIISAYELGKRSMSLETAVAIREALLPELRKQTGRKFKIDLAEFLARRQPGAK